MQLELVDIHKHFGALRANDGICMTIAPGTIYGILGENGAGKSTLMKILAGFIRKTSGQILIDGKPVELHKPAQAARHGIGMLYQEPLDFAAMTVLENFISGQRHGLWLRKRHARQALSQACAQFGFELHPAALVEDLTIGERQQLEIVRLITMGIGLLILDEPTTGISQRQKNVLFKALRHLADQGRSIVLVSHKLEDIESLCDRITVLRRGRVSGEFGRPFEREKLLRAMFGQPPQMPQRTPPQQGAVLLRLQGVVASGGRAGLQPCDFTLHQGEIVGLAGLEGSGQGVFLRVAAGLIRPQAGEVYFDDRRLARVSYHDLQRQGVFFLPTARLAEGLIPGLSLAEHFAILRQRRFWLQRRAATHVAREQIQAFGIKGEPYSLVEALSGGNQQKLLLSFLPAQARLLLLEHPTRGLDVQSANWIWQHLQERCQKGTSIVFSSAELDEIFRVAHRILVFFNGQLVGDALTDKISPQEASSAIAGAVATVSP